MGKQQKSGSTKVYKEEDSQKEGKEGAKGGDDDPAPIMNALQMLQFGLKLNRKSETVVSEEPGSSTEPSPKGKKAKKKEKREKEKKAKEDSRPRNGAGSRRKRRR